MVYMAPAGQPFDEIKSNFDPSRTVFRAAGDNLDEVKFAWTEKDIFAISYERLRIFSFTNFGEIRKPDGSAKEYEVRLVQSSVK